MQINLTGSIKTSKHLKGDFGDSELKKRSFEIRIAEDKNNTKEEFSATLLHELLHLWLDLTNRTFNVKLTSDEEHAIIYDSEAVIRYFHILNLKERRKV